MQLPYFNSLEIKYLNRLFDNTSESYKFFWFQAIINKIIEEKDIITYDELINEMISNAWYMVTEYHLKLGPKDTLEKLVLYINTISNMKPSEKKEIILEYLKNCDNKEVLKKKRILTYNVPYHLQAPFMYSIKGKDWSVPESALIARINQEKRLIYYFNKLNGLKTEIYIQPEWYNYIYKNQEILKGWLQYNMIIYLQKRNPSVPGIADKLQPPRERKLDKVQK